MKVLYFGNDQEEFNFIQNILNVHFKKIKLLKATNQQQLIDILSYDGPIGFAIIDTANKDLAPDAVYENLIGFIGEKPALFVGTMATIKDRVDQKTFSKLEANDYILRPLDKELEDFKVKLSKCIDVAQEQQFEQSMVDVNREDYISMKIKSFYIYNEFPYDLYVEVTSSKFILGIAKNTPYTQGDIQRFVKKGIKNFYLKKDEQLKFLEETIKRVTVQIQTTNAGVELTKNHIIAFTVIQNYVTNFGVTPSVQELTDLLVDSISLLTRESQLVNVLETFPLVGGGIPARSVLVCYICDHILKGLGWTAKSSKGKLVLASLLHDAFLAEDDWSKIQTLDDDMFLKLSEEDKIKYNSHIEKASQVTNQFSGYSEINFIIEQHHELPTGDGFPHGWSAMKLSLLSCIFITAYNFAGMCVEIELNKPNLKKLIRFMAKTYNVGNFKEPLKVLLKNLDI